MNLNPDSPVPYTLTPKAHAALTSAPPETASLYCGCGYDDCSACAGNGWACLGCGDAYFGTAPDDGLCPHCLAQDDQEAADDSAWWETVEAMDAAGLLATSAEPPEARA